MNNTQCAIAVRYITNQYTERQQVMNIIKVLTQFSVLPHFLVYAVNVLGSPGYLGFQTHPIKLPG